MKNINPQFIDEGEDTLINNCEFEDVDVRLKGKRTSFLNSLITTKENVKKHPIIYMIIIPLIVGVILLCIEYGIFIQK
ncbi:hypothetical protein A2310_04025 [candidate division WOR-1 bacterium RIFOXYB2_FULL_37_13]|uniref:Uncharacterized protein n=1 Tax=candidate division WOR-1 bacterium RIFOXYB2_FULL_37_13 TaxID=1802579 RepID=A0A1F4SND4_UNCSA|nr:MAG: hypothetical protein A2310_04025 [candidate division WOR-1 bacterium RIFOXYB2_FULL_37_13]